jgi:hypothetical protein
VADQEEEVDTALHELLHQLVVKIASNQLFADAELFALVQGYGGARGKAWRKQAERYVRTGVAALLSRGGESDGAFAS